PGSRTGRRGPRGPARRRGSLSRRPAAGGEWRRYTQRRRRRRYAQARTRPLGNPRVGKNRPVLLGRGWRPNLGAGYITICKRMCPIASKCNVESFANCSHADELASAVLFVVRALSTFARSRLGRATALRSGARNTRRRQASILINVRLWQYASGQYILHI